MTMANFNSNTNNPNGLHKSNQGKHETQMNFYSSNNNNIKQNPFSSSYYDPKNGLNKKKPTMPKKPEPKEPLFPEPPKNDPIEQMSSSVGFRLSSGEFKKGITLDKVLGAGFKKIEIYDANLKEFEGKTFVPDHIIDEKINEMSEAEEKYAYESFEIVETENEEEGNPESQQSKRTFRNFEEKKEPKERPKLDPTDEIKNNEILDKIQKKYKSSKSKQIYKKKSKLFSKLEAKSPENRATPTNLSEENGDISDREKNIPIKEAMPMEKRGREHALGKIESKSLSPKVSQDMKKPRFQGTFDNSKGIGVTQYNAYNATPFRTSKQQFYPKNEMKNETQGAFRTSSTSFRTTKESLKNNDYDGLNGYTNSYVKKSFQPRLNNNSIIEPEKDRAYLEYERSNNRSNSMINADQFSETSMKFYSEKLVNGHLEQKFHRENKLMTQMIKKNEQDLIDKYSKKFKFNNEESKYL